MKIVRCATLFFAACARASRTYAGPLSQARITKIINDDHDGNAGGD
jgi:hypothetical protein